MKNTFTVTDFAFLEEMMMLTMEAKQKETEDKEKELKELKDLKDLAGGKLKDKDKDKSGFAAPITNPTAAANPALRSIYPILITTSIIPTPTANKLLQNLIHSTFHLLPATFPISPYIPTLQHEAPPDTVHRNIHSFSLHTPTGHNSSEQDQNIQLIETSSNSTSWVLLAVEFVSVGFWGPSCGSAAADDASAINQCEQLSIRSSWIFGIEKEKEMKEKKIKN
ncbi:MAG: hypothetical protein EZS28_001043 [Streblomastix strix]|uniref:Uncharacterized protein n=1 Tax=Streblomastix strix TaxID=222440 RepID=A0A5J4X8P5_9EUKA|nr:MAG: hypothetical protein EZS28_001043 [Streblomastix strix]